MYGHTFFASEIDRYKVFALDPKTKKLLYPELRKKQNKINGKR